MAGRKKKDATPARNKTRTGRLKVKRRAGAPYVRVVEDEHARRLRAEIDQAMDQGRQLREAIYAKIEQKIREAEEEERRAASAPPLTEASPRPERGR